MLLDLHVTFVKIKKKKKFKLATDPFKSKKNKSNAGIPVFIIPCHEI